MAEKEYIEREAAKGCVKEHYDDAIIIAIDRIPAADVRPVVRGKWKVYNNTYVCSACGRPISFWQSNFCPNCGADMREES